MKKCLDKGAHHTFPKFTFLDPWGYKGLSQKIFKAAIQGKGSEFAFFFNYNRIRPGINNELVEELIADIFGEERRINLKNRLNSLSPEDSEKVIMENLTSSLKEIGARFVSYYCFKDDEKERTSHYLVYATKHPRGFKVMQEIMAKQSSIFNDGYASLSLDPYTKRKVEIQKQVKQLVLFDELAEPDPIDKLCNMLIQDFSNKTYSVFTIFSLHQSKRGVATMHYTLKSYKLALSKLESEGKVLINPPLEIRRINTLSDEAIVSFI